MNEILAPAKVNLCLRVVKKRPDGYHEIETIFERISIFDKISITPSDKNVILCGNKDVPVGEGSLLMNIIDRFTKKFSEINPRHKTAGHTVNLEKNIPIGAGLGGGSSDAAALLMGLNDITGRCLSLSHMLDIANSLGSDISFFLYNARFALGKGRGEEIKKLESDVKLSHILVNPPFKILTKEVYDKYSKYNSLMDNKTGPLTLTKKSVIDRMVTSFLEGEKASSIFKNLFNDLERGVLKEYPALEKVFFEIKKAGAKATLLSGSGPTVFGIFEDEETQGALESLSGVFREKDGWKTFAARTF